MNGNPQYKNFRDWQRTKRVWLRISLRSVRKNITGAEAADAFTARARREGDLVIKRPCYDPHRFENATKCRAVAAVLFATGMIGLVALLLRIFSPSPITFVIATLFLVLSGAYFLYARYLGDERLPAFITSAAHQGAAVLRADLGEDGVAPRSLAGFILKVAALAIEAALCGLVIVGAFSGQLPFLFAIAAAVVISAVFVSVCNKMAASQITKLRKQLEVRDRYERLAADADVDALAKERAQRMREVVRDFVHDKFRRATKWERARPYVAILGLLTVLLFLVWLRAASVEAPALEAAAMIAAALLATWFFAAHAFAGCPTS